MVHLLRFQKRMHSIKHLNKYVKILKCIKIALQQFCCYELCHYLYLRLPIYYSNVVAKFFNEETKLFHSNVDAF